MAETSGRSERRAIELSCEQTSAFRERLECCPEAIGEINGVLVEVEVLEGECHVGGTPMIVGLLRAEKGER